MKTTAYLRVSTIDQDLDKNRADILKLANDKKLGNVTFIEEKISGTIPWHKRKINKIINEAKEGDAIIVSELSRLGRSMLDVMEIISILNTKKISLYSVKGDWQLDNTMQSKIIAMVFAMAAEIEKDFISTRTKEALQARKAKGLPLGRPKGRGKSKLDPYEDEIKALLANGSTKKFICEKYNTSDGNLFNWLNKLGLNKKQKETK